MSVPVKRFIRTAGTITAVILSACNGGGGNPVDGGNPSQPVVISGSFTDSRDGKSYRTVTIGTQTWMAENLNYAETGMCYDNDESNCAIYGRLYTWIMAMDLDSSFINTRWDGSDVNHRGICPMGWHLPSFDEWRRLVHGVGVTGTKLKSQTWWTDNDGNPTGNGTDDFGFSALPGGRGNRSGDFFIGIGSSGLWWTATETSHSNARYWAMNYYSDGVGTNSGGSKGWAYSVRCVRD